MGRDPRRFVMSSSYNAILAADFGKQARNISEEKLTAQIFPKWYPVQIRSRGRPTRLDKKIGWADVERDYRRIVSSGLRRSMEAFRANGIHTKAVKKQQPFGTNVSLFLCNTTRKH